MRKRQDDFFQISHKKIRGLYMLKIKKIESAVANCLVEAGTTFRKDQLKAYRNAIAKENNSNAKWVLERVLENARIAEKNTSPLCDDTGIPHVIVEMGDLLKLPAGWLAAIYLGIEQGLRLMPGRPMAVKGNDRDRIEQSKGLYKDPAKLSPAPVIVKPVPGKNLKITVLLLGGGPEIRAKTYRIFHKRSIENVLKEAAGWMASEMNNLGCTPSTLAVGIGRTHMEASALMLEAMSKGTLSRQTVWEKKVTDWINAEPVGPLGLGGATTVLGTFIKVGPLRASGVRIVSVRPCCCLEPRKATVTLGHSD
jgi:fumarate hydratase subunit alpha